MKDMTLGEEVGVRSARLTRVVEGSETTTLAATCRAPRSLLSGHKPCVATDSGGEVSWVSWRCRREEGRGEGTRYWGKSGIRWLSEGVGARDALLERGGLSRGVPLGLIVTGNIGIIVLEFRLRDLPSRNTGPRASSRITLYSGVTALNRTYTSKQSQCERRAGSKDRSSRESGIFF